MSQCTFQSYYLFPLSASPNTELWLHVSCTNLDLYLTAVLNLSLFCCLIDQTEQNRHIVRKPTLLMSSVENQGGDRKTVSVKCPKFAKKTVLDSLTYLCNDCIYVECTVE